MNFSWVKVNASVCVEKYDIKTLEKCQTMVVSTKVS